jgi:CRISPR-associated protein Csb2
MATTLLLRLPWGRFHATPWDRNVNEGIIDWPPSPWRLLRALYATWRTRAPHLSEGAVLGALARLTDPPTYTLPAYRSGHTRHYLPDLAHRTGMASTDKILDAFVVTERNAELAVTWPGDLPADEHAALSELAASLPYVGRAETICLARVANGGDSDGYRAYPLGEGELIPEGATLARLLTPSSPLNTEQLTTTSAAVRGARLVRPPGTRWIDYVVPGEIGARPPTAREPTRHPTLVRWVVASRARPSVHATVAVTHVLRAACQSAFGRMFREASSSQLSGKDDDGKPLKGHIHAHYLAIDRPDPGRARGDRRIENLLVWVDGNAGGITDDVLAALGTVHLGGLRGHEHLSDFRPLRLGLEGIGSGAEIAPELTVPPPLGRMWESHTPFVPPRHRKRGQEPADFVMGEVSRELRNRNLPTPRSVSFVPGDWLAYRRHRRRLAEGRWATGLRLEFDEPLAGPISIGALSHFGLGLFVPVG